MSVPGITTSLQSLHLNPPSAPSLETSPPAQTPQEPSSNQAPHSPRQTMQKAVALFTGISTEVAEVLSSEKRYASMMQSAKEVSTAYKEKTKELSEHIHNLLDQDKVPKAVRLVRILPESKQSKLLYACVKKYIAQNNLDDAVALTKTIQKEEYLKKAVQECAVPLLKQKKETQANNVLQTLEEPQRNNVRYAIVSIFITNKEVDIAFSVAKTMSPGTLKDLTLEECVIAFLAQERMPEAFEAIEAMSRGFQQFKIFETSIKTLVPLTKPDKVDEAFVKAKQMLQVYQEDTSLKKYADIFSDKIFENLVDAFLMQKNGSGVIEAAKFIQEPLFRDRMLEKCVTILLGQKNTPDAEKAARLISNDFKKNRNLEKCGVVIASPKTTPPPKSTVTWWPF